MDSHHHHHDRTSPAHLNKAFVIGIILNFLFVLIEVFMGLSIHSLSLLSDAGHNLADVGSLALSLLAFRLVKVKPSANYTYGYRKTSILVSLFNAMVLLISIGAIAYEAIHRLFQPEPLPGTTIAWVAGIGIIINAATALLFLRDKEKDLNIKSTYLHLMSDAVVSLALVMGGIIIFYTHWFWIDSILSIIVALVILFSTWHLLADSLRLSMDGVPPDINPDEVKAIALKTEGIKGMHHIHIWALSTTETALTAHLVLEKNVTQEQEQQIKAELKHQLEHHHIQHATLETESESAGCITIECE